MKENEKYEAEDFSLARIRIKEIEDLVEEQNNYEKHHHHRVTELKNKSLGINLAEI